MSCVAVVWLRVRGRATSSWWVSVCFMYGLEGFKVANDAAAVWLLVLGRGSLSVWV